MPTILQTIFNLKSYADYFIKKMLTILRKDNANYITISPDLWPAKLLGEKKDHPSHKSTSTLISNIGFDIHELNYKGMN